MLVDFIVDKKENIDFIKSFLCDIAPKNFLLKANEKTGLVLIELEEFVEEAKKWEKVYLKLKEELKHDICDYRFAYTISCNLIQVTLKLEFYELDLDNEKHLVSSIEIFLENSEDLNKIDELMCVFFSGIASYFRFALKKELDFKYMRLIEANNIKKARTYPFSSYIKNKE